MCGIRRDRSGVNRSRLESFRPQGLQVGGPSDAAPTPLVSYGGDISPSAFFGLAQELDMDIFSSPASGQVWQPGAVVGWYTCARSCVWVLLCCIPGAFGGWAGIHVCMWALLCWRCWAVCVCACREGLSHLKLAPSNVVAGAVGLYVYARAWGSFSLVADCLPGAGVVVMGSSVCVFVPVGSSCCSRLSPPGH